MFCLRTTLSKPCVLIRDMNGLWVDSSSIYFSASSSLVGRHPLSCIYDSYLSYCPQCLRTYSEDERVSSNNSCRTCFQCPDCFCILVKAATGNLVCDDCGKSYGSEAETDSNCHWSENRPQGIKQRVMLAMNEHQRMSKESLPDSSLLTSISPLSVRLLSKLIVRCRRDADLGELNILMQPSSSLIATGNWWIKDSSALHSIPSVTLVRLPDGTNTPSDIILRLLVSNPRDRGVKVGLEWDSNECGYEDEELFPPFSPVVAVFDISSRLERSEKGERTHAKHGVCFVLDGYEDDLLRDDDDGDIYDELLLATSDAALATENSPPSSLFRVRVCRHQAVVSVHVNLSADEFSPFVGAGGEVGGAKRDTMDPPPPLAFLPLKLSYTSSVDNDGNSTTNNSYRLRLYMPSHFFQS